jgi:hypothetical protein
MTPWKDYVTKPTEQTLLEAGKRAIPPGGEKLLAGKIPGRGGYFIKLEQAYDDSYAKYLDNQTIKIGAPVRRQLAQIADASPSTAAGKRLHAWMADKQYLKGDTITGVEFKKLQSELRSELRNLEGREGSQMLKNVFRNAEKELIKVRNASLPGKISSKLNQIDEAYANGEILKTAAGYKGSAKEGITPETFLSATETAPKGFTTQGTEKLGDLSRSLADVTEKSKIPWWVAHGPGVIAAPFTGATSMLATGVVPSAVALSGRSPIINKLMMGQFPKQKAMAKFLRDNAAQLGAAEGAVPEILKD